MRDEDEFLRVKGIGDKDEIFGTVEPVTEEKGDMIDFGLLENDKASQHIDHDLEECIEGAAALESYTKILDASKWDGISKQTARAMLVGLKRIDKTLGLDATLSVALEDETGGDMKRIGQEKSEVVTSSSIGDKAKQLWAKFREILERFVEKAKEIWQKLTDKNDKVVEKAAEMKAAAPKEFSGPNDEKGGRKVTIPANLAWLSCPDGVQVEASHYHELTVWCLGDMAGFVQDGIDELLKAITAADIDAIHAIAERKAPEYTGTKFPQIEIEPNDKGGWAVVTGVQGEDVVIPAIPLNDYMSRIAKVEAEGNYLKEHRKAALGLMMQLMRLLKDTSTASNDADTKVILAVLTALESLKAAQEQVTHVYQFISNIQSAILITLGKQI